MTGATHLAGGAAVSVGLLVGPGGVTIPGRALLSGHPLPAVQAAHLVLVAGLVLVGLVASLFPDLDAPQSELQSAPRKLARGAGRAAALVGVRRRGLGGTVLRGAFAGLGALGSLGIGGLAAAIQTFTPHRGWTHTFAGLLTWTGVIMAITAGLGLLGRSQGGGIWSGPLLVGAVWAAGYLTHLLLDAETPHGVPLWRGHIFHLLARRAWVRTGSVVDVVVLRGGAWGLTALLVLGALR